MWLPDLAPWQWAIAAVSAVLVGIAKTGVPGFGILAVPLMVLAVGDARRSAGWLLPLLCVADVFAVAIYRRHAYARRLFTLVPWVAAGMIAGAITLGARERTMRFLVAAIVVAMTAIRWWRTRVDARTPAPSTLTSPPASTPASPPALARPTSTDTRASWKQSAIYGVVAGFATMIANAAGPVMSLYLLAKRLPKDEFVGTGAWFFLIVNLSKVPVYAGRGLMSGRSLAFDLALVPAVAAGAGVGRAVVRRLPQRLFEQLVFALTAIAAALLFVPK